MCENEKKNTHSIEMTSGSLWKNLLLFSLPLMGSQVLEGGLQIIWHLELWVPQLCWSLYLPES